MRAAVVLDNLLNKLSFLNMAVSSKTQLPALTGFLIETEKGKIKISSSDLEIGIVTTLPASIEEEGTALVPAKPLTELLTSLTDEKIEIEKKDGSMTISGKKAKASLVCLDETEFPKVVADKGEEAGRLKKEDAQKKFLRTSFAAAQDAARPAMSGVLIKTAGGKTAAVATDSHRLSLDADITVRGVAGFNALVPARTIKALLSYKGAGDIVVYVSQKNNQIIFEQDNTLLVGRLIDAQYPEYEKIIPKDFATKTEFDREEMQSALKTAAIFARENANIIRFSVRKNSVDVFAKGSGVGENKTEVVAQTTGEENEIAFNIRYVQEFLQNTDGEKVVFEMTGPLNPGVFKIAEDPSFIHLIMPIRVKDEELTA